MTSAVKVGKAGSTPAIPRTDVFLTNRGKLPPLGSIPRSHYLMPNAALRRPPTTKPERETKL